jgi:Flp pilus assembly protein CpaB
MSRRRRAAAFAVLAALAAALAGAIVDGYGSRVASSYGELRPVVVTSSELPRRRTLDPSMLSGALEVRRVPARFVPPGALRAPADALGLEPVADLPAGSYLVASALRPPRAPAKSDGLAGGRRPVEIRVSGAGALEASGPLPPRPRVDVVVTSQPTGPGPGRTRVAAEAVPLLSLSPGKAILGLSRKQALELIAAESFARQVTLLVSPR